MQRTDVHVPSRCEYCGYIQVNVEAGDLLAIFSPERACLLVFTCPKCALRQRLWLPDYTVQITGIRQLYSLFPHRVIALPDRIRIVDVENPMSKDDLIDFGLCPDDELYRRITGQEQDV